MKKIRTIQADIYSESGAHVTVADGDGGSEAILGASADAHISANESFGISLSPGRGKKVNVQAMPNDVVFGGLFSMPSVYQGLVPSTIATPNPQYSMKPPFEHILQTVRELAILSSSFVV